MLPSFPSAPLSTYFQISEIEAVLGPSRLGSKFYKDSCQLILYDFSVTALLLLTSSKISNSFQKTQHQLLRLLTITQILFIFLWKADFNIFRKYIYFVPNYCLLQERPVTAKAKFPVKKSCQIELLSETFVDNTITAIKRCHHVVNSYFQTGVKSSLLSNLILQNIVKHILKHMLHMI